MIDRTQGSARRMLLLVPAALVLHGCASSPEGDGAVVRTVEPASRLQRENALQTAWRGRSYRALVETFGSPRMIMSLPSYRPVRTEVVVYGETDKATRCIDAFTIVMPGNSGDAVVEDYFCR